MKYTANQIAAMTGEPNDGINSLRASVIARIRRGDLHPVGEYLKQGAKMPEPTFDLSGVCIFKVLFELARIGCPSGNELAQGALQAMTNWSIIRPQVADYARPIDWAMAHIRAGGDVALAIYTCKQGPEVCIVSAVFDAGAPLIPRYPVIRIAISLTDVLAHILSTADYSDQAIQ